jgi:hypothetical protein
MTMASSAIPKATLVEVFSCAREMPSLRIDVNTNGVNSATVSQATAAAPKATFHRPGRLTANPYAAAPSATAATIIMVMCNPPNVRGSWAPDNQVVANASESQSASRAELRS